MINTSELEILIKLCIVSPFVKGEKGVSLLLVAPPEHAKSELIKLFMPTQSIKITTDFQANLFAQIAFEIQSGKIRTLGILDFLRITQRKQSVVANTLGIINALIEEGYTGNLPMGQHLNSAIRANIITSITPDEIKDKRHKWTKTGTLSRFLWVSFKYKEGTKNKIRQYLQDRIYTGENLFDIRINENDISIPSEIGEKIKELSLELAIENKVLGFRLQKQLQNLVMASALYGNRPMVMEGDYELILQLSKFMNFKYTEI